MASAVTHERPKEVLNIHIKVLRDELDIDVESLGSTTLKAELIDINRLNSALGPWLHRDCATRIALRSTQATLAGCAG